MFTVRHDRKVTSLFVVSGQNEKLFVIAGGTVPLKGFFLLSLFLSVFLRVDLRRPLPLCGRSSS